MLMCVDQMKKSGVQSVSTYNKDEGLNSLVEKQTDGELVPLMPHGRSCSCDYRRKQSGICGEQSQ
jgi:hypothetical protein